MKAARQPSRRLAKASIALGWIVLLGSFAFVLMWNTVTIGDGVRTVSVTIKSTEGRIKTVRGWAFHHLADAEKAAFDTSRNMRYFEFADEKIYTGAPLEIDSWVTVKSNMFRHDRTAQDYVVVVAKFDDGRQVGRILEVPRGGGPFAFDVTLP